MDDISKISERARLERARLERLLDEQALEFRRAFGAYLQDLQSSTPVFQKVRQLLSEGDINAVLTIPDSYMGHFKVAILHIFQVVGSVTTDSLRRKFPDQALRKAAVVFDSSHPRAAELMRRNQLEFVTNFSKAQRTVTRNALTTALEQGQGPLAAARAFRDSIGLTEWGAEAVDRYEALLQAGSRSALDRVLRDRRFDPSVEQAAAGGDPLTDTQIERMVDRYRARVIGMRSETIARTETLRILNQAREEAVQQMLQQTGIAPDSVIRTWRATHDKRTRDTHAAMDGQTRGIDQPFQSPSGALLMYPGDPDAPAGEIINCRCVITTEVR